MCSMNIYRVHRKGEMGMCVQHHDTRYNPIKYSWRAMKAKASWDDSIPQQKQIISWFALGFLIDDVVV